MEGGIGHGNELVKRHGRLARQTQIGLPIDLAGLQPRVNDRGRRLLVNWRLHLFAFSSKSGMERECDASLAELGVAAQAELKRPGRRRGNSNEIV